MVVKPKSSNEIGFPCWKVRICMRGGAIIHLLSRKEPVMVCRVTGDGGPVDMDIIEGTEHGDTLGLINWLDVSAITWRPSDAPVG